MPHAIHDTTKPRHLQGEQRADDWDTEVVPRLPEGLEQQAKVLKAFERSREIRCASDLLRGLLAYVYTVHSFAHLSMWSVLLGLADVSANDWRKRLQKASALLDCLLKESLANHSAVSPWLARAVIRRVNVILSSHRN